MDSQPPRNDPPPSHEPDDLPQSSGHNQPGIHSGGTPDDAPFAYRPAGQTQQGYAAPQAPAYNPYAQPYAQSYAQAMPLAHSGPGIASLIIAVISVISYVVAFGYLVSLGIESGGGEPDPQDPGVIAGGCSLIVTGMLNLVGLILGFIGVFQKDRRTLTAILGLALNGLPMLCVGAIILLGMVMQARGLG